MDLKLKINLININVEKELPPKSALCSYKETVKVRVLHECQPTEECSGLIRCTLVLKDPKYRGDADDAQHGYNQKSFFLRENFVFFREMSL